MEPFWGLWLFKMLLKQLNNLKVKKNKLNFSFQMILPMNQIRSLIQMTHKMLQLKMIMKPFNLRMLLLMHQLIIQSMKKEKFLSLKDKLSHKILLKLKQKKKRSLELLRNWKNQKNLDLNPKKLCLKVWKRLENKKH